ncbi:MAG: Ig-like domain-containing protein, partial [Candidatus Thiodiazotropha sp.]
VDTFTSKGLVEFLSTGSTFLRAEHENHSAQASITVNHATQAPTLEQITIQPASQSQNVGTSLQFEAVGSYSDQTTSTITDQVDWSVDDPAIASVDNTNQKGLVEFLSTGTTTLRVVQGQFSAQAILTATDDSQTTPVLQGIRVQPSSLTLSVGADYQFTAIGDYSDGSSSTVTEILDWSVSDNSIASVDNANSKGLVSFLSPGSTTVTAFGDGVSGQSALTVTSNTSNRYPSLLRTSPDNPRYFENAEGDEVLLVGSHTWLNGQDAGPSDPPALFDYTAWLDFLEQHNHNFFRLWSWEQAAWTNNEPLKWYLDPPQYARTGPGDALDGGLRFDLTQFNEDYFNRIRQRVIEAGNRGIYVAVMLFQGWSVTTKEGHGVNDPWDGHPFNAQNNINGIDGDINGDGNGTELHEINGLTAWQEAFARKMVDTVNDLDNVIYEISNESHTGSTAWQYQMIDFIRTYEATKPKQHPIGMTAIWPGGTNQELLASPADWISLNGSLDNPPVADGAKVILADTDHLCGICGNRGWAWKSFTRGENPLFMDPYIDVYDSIDIPLNDPQFVSLRESLGYIRSYAQRIDLSRTVPCGGLATSQNCLGYKSATQAEFLVYFPSAETVNIDLTGANFDLDVEWFNPANGSAQSGGTVTGGSS